VWSSNDATLRIVIRPKFHQTVWALLLAVLAAGGVVTAVFVLRTRQARLRERQLVELVKERTQLLENANQQLEILVNLDGLTGITNRRHFMERYAVEWKRACRSRTWISIVFADIDHFKIFNDTFGHQAGDECLRRVAHVFDASLHRPADLVARYGGEEFVAMLPETDSQGAIAVAEFMRHEVLNLKIQHADSVDPNVVSASFGVASVLPDPGMDSEDLLERADSALYRAKEAGRNRTAED
jgi:diguanylate cyclase (GGDEF)-like protein